MPSEAARQNFLSHLRTVRAHLLWGAGLFFAIAAGIFFYGAETLIQLLLAPLQQHSKETLVFLSPLGPFLFTMQVSVYAAIAVCLPLWFGLVLHFVFPALPQHKRYIAMIFVGSSVLACCIGIGITYLYLIPTTLQFLLNFVVPGTTFLLTAESYLNFFLLELCVAVVVLHLPLIIVFLAYLRVLSPYVLASQRRLVYVGLLIALAVLTPTTDAVTLVLVSLPAMALTEAGIATAKVLYKKRVV